MASTTDRWTEQDIPTQDGKVAVVTGANSGLGLQTARALAEHGAHVVLAVRNLDKGREALARISERAPGAKLSLQRLDLASSNRYARPPMSCTRRIRRSTCSSTTRA